MMDLALKTQRNMAKFDIARQQVATLRAEVAALEHPSRHKAPAPLPSPSPPSVEWGQEKTSYIVNPVWFHEQRNTDINEKHVSARTRAVESLAS